MKTNIEHRTSNTEHRTRLLSRCLLASALCLLMPGCAVPKARISGTIAGQKFSATTPKDTDMQDFEVSVIQSGTNTTAAKIKIGTLKTRMNPDVISSQGAANTAMMNAASTMLEKAGSALGAAAGTAINAAK